MDFNGFNGIQEQLQAILRDLKGLQGVLRDFNWNKVFKGI